MSMYCVAVVCTHVSMLTSWTQSILPHNTTLFWQKVESNSLCGIRWEMFASSVFATFYNFLLKLKKGNTLTFMSLYEL